MTESEKPSPPGNPMREDEPSGGRPGGHDDDASAGAAGDESGHTIPVEDEQPDPDTEPGDGHELQEENAETSQDQPSQ